ncbi:hypothetical protein VB738_13520 [Cyanobium gracile UHCC 0139]|uniref:Uncharacterized protein n=1 Tax=Cyanobium gracile UHCC 0139 TaxID=3110308 RepID=A0ABU5RWX3_9CYAN|nr:hypothetical protein [Cyanobium gracile]MEA5392276.1 hypothetical protein [Cyanobium gracile UHCC 0139]
MGCADLVRGAATGGGAAGGAELSWAFGRSRDALAQLQELHRHLRSHRQIRAAEQLRQQVGRFWPSIAPPVVRTLHHVACSGGTLISRYLAALPDVVLLSELNPANRYGADAGVAGLWALRLAAAKPW